MAHESYETFEAVKARLDEIVEAVSSDDVPLDDALVLYEEAVGLGLRASDLLETNIEAHNEQEVELEESSQLKASEQPLSSASIGVSDEDAASSSILDDADAPSEQTNASAPA